MKHAVLAAADVLVTRASEYGDFSMQLVLEAGFRCLENACIAESSVPLLKRIGLIRQWLVAPGALSESQKDDLTGVTWCESWDDLLEHDVGGWEPLLEANPDLTKPGSVSAVVQSFAFVLRKRDRPDSDGVETAVFRFSVFLALLLCWQGREKKRIRLELQQLARTLAWANKKEHPNASHELRSVLVMG